MCLQERNCWRHSALTSFQLWTCAWQSVRKRITTEEPPSKKNTGDVAREVGREIVAAVRASGGPLQVAFENIFCASQSPTCSTVPTGLVADHLSQGCRQSEPCILANSRNLLITYRLRRDKPDGWISDGFSTYDRARKGGCVEKVVSHREELRGQKLGMFHNGNFFWWLCSYR